MTDVTPTKSCVYVTRGWGVHDDRWVDAIAACGFTVHSVDATHHEPTDLRDRVSELAAPATPIVAGPLDSVTRHLIGLRAPVIGLSWGFDLHHMTDTAWLGDLAGLIVDSKATHGIAVRAGVSAESITTLPWGVDLQQFTPSGPKVNPNEFDLPAECSIVLSLRAHEPMYRVQDIIECFAQIAETHPQAHLVVGHQGSLTAELQAHAHHRGLDDRVRFIGQLPEEELPQILRTASVYVTASEVDGTSVTLLQAMACGTPVLASDTPGNREWVDPETGFLATTGSPESFAAQLDRILSNPEQAKARSRHARDTVQTRADWQANRALLCAVLQKAST